MSIANEFFGTACAFTANIAARIGFLRNVVSVKAFATNNFPVLIGFLRIAVFQGSRWSSAAVTSVPVATTDIVAIVTIAVTFPLGLCTVLSTCLWRWNSKSWVLAFAFCAIFESVFGSAAITFVPTTFAVVVVVVAKSVISPGGMATLGFVCASTLASAHATLVFRCNAVTAAVMERFWHFAH